MPRRIARWGPEQVQEWLSGLGLARYNQAFGAAAVDGEMLLRFVDETAPPEDPLRDRSSESLASGRRRPQYNRHSSAEGCRLSRYCASQAVAYCTPFYTPSIVSGTPRAFLRAAPRLHPYVVAPQTRPPSPSRVCTGAHIARDRRTQPPPPSRVSSSTIPWCFLAALWRHGAAFTRNSPSPWSGAKFCTG